MPRNHKKGIIPRTPLAASASANTFIPSKAFDSSKDLILSPCISAIAEETPPKLCPMIGCCRNTLTVSSNESSRWTTECAAVSDNPVPFRKRNAIVGLLSRILANRLKLAAARARQIIDGTSALSVCRTIRLCARSLNTLAHAVRLCRIMSENMNTIPIRLDETMIPAAVIQ